MSAGASCWAKSIAPDWRSLSTVAASVTGWKMIESRHGMCSVSQ